jgi:hypothetical protein
MPYAEPNTPAQLRAAIRKAQSEGAAWLVVPFFGGNSGAFDQMIEQGHATGYRLLVELSLPRGESL